MAPERRKAIDRVRKLVELERRESTPPNEAAAARVAAQQLIDQHHIREHEVRDQPPPDESAPYTGAPGEGMERLFRVLANIVRNGF